MIAAYGAMRVKRIIQGHQASMKTSFAGSAAPWIHTKYAVNIVRTTLAAGTTGIFAFTDRAVHLGLFNSNFWTGTE
jgi:hypothetical protein